MRVYDIHSHILAGIDDGAFGMDETVKMARMAFSAHTVGMVCTPHVFASDPYPSEIVTEKTAQARSALAENGIPLKLFTGQEVFADNRGGLLKMFEKGQLLTLNGSMYPLIEFDPASNEADVLRTLEQMLAGGFVPIAAHPERYEFVAEDTDVLKKMRKLGVLIQLNKGSVSGRFGRNAARIAAYMLENRLADLIASDAHSPYMRTPVMRDIHEYISEEYSADYADHLMCKCPLMILKNEKI